MHLLIEFSEPSYSFYKIRVDDEIKISFPEVKRDDIVLFGSFRSIKSDVRDDLVICLKNARSAGALVIYDPNFRPVHIKMRDKAMDYILENISLSNIVKGSNEDFQNIFESSSAHSTREIIKTNGCNNLIYTANKYGVNLFTNDFHKIFDVPRIDPISTVGAGDNFSAGLIYALINENIYASDLEKLDHDVWRTIIRVAIDFAINVCQSYDNYIGEDFVMDYVRNGRINEC